MLARLGPHELAMCRLSLIFRNSSRFDRGRAALSTMGMSGDSWLPNSSMEKSGIGEISMNITLDYSQNVIHFQSHITNVSEFVNVGVDKIYMYEQP